jgi:glycosyltransferase involved in cell wall biosynthesis
VRKKVKILHALGGLTAGGVETWLYNLLSQVDLERYQMDFMTFSDKKGVYDDLISKLGCRIYYFPKTKNILKIAKYYIKTVRDDKYDIVHCHRHLLCGVFFLINRFTKAQFIAHSHNTSTDSSLFVFRYFSKISKSIIKTIPYKLACSEDASIALFDRVETIIDYGINTNLFVPSEKKHQSLLDLFNLNNDNVIVGHVGRFTKQKNHEHIINIAKRIVKQNDKYHFVFVGEGMLENEIKEKITAAGLEANVHIAGVRTDVNRFMNGFFDIYLFPSLYEGLGIVLLEAQSAGLPIVFSSIIPKRVDVINELVHRLDLENDANYWADYILSDTKMPTISERVSYHNLFNESEYSIKKSAAKLLSFYDNINLS